MKTGINRLATPEDFLCWEKVCPNIENAMVVGLESEATIQPNKKYPYCASNNRVLENLTPCKNMSKTYPSCVNCEFYKSVKPTFDNCSRFMTHQLNPQRHHYFFGNHGVSEVTTDGSVPSGIEIKTTGIPIDPPLLQYTYNQIVSRLNYLGAITDQYSGLHYHILVTGGYDGGALSQYYWPSNFLYNFSVLSTIALPVLSFFGRGVKLNGELTTRYAAFRLPCLITKYMNNQDFLSFISKQPPHNRPGKYLAVTPYLSQVNNTGFLMRPHIEFRYADNVLSSDYYLFHVLLGAAIFKRATRYAPDEIISLQDPMYHLAQELIVKMVNMGAEQRLAFDALTQKDMDKLNQIKNALTEEIQHDIMCFDPKGNMLLNWQKMGISLKGGPIPQYQGPSYQTSLNVMKTHLGASLAKAKPTLAWNPRPVTVTRINREPRTREFTGVVEEMLDEATTAAGVDVPIGTTWATGTTATLR